MGNRKRIGSLFCLSTNLARNRTAIRTQIRTRVDGPLRESADISSLTTDLTGIGTRDHCIRSPRALIDWVMHHGNVQRSHDGRPGGRAVGRAVGGEPSQKRKGTGGRQTDKQTDRQTGRQTDSSASQRFSAKHWLYWHGWGTTLSYWLARCMSDWRGRRKRGERGSSYWSYT
jgi:hypothetical protein